jgi:hypothetical protein
MEHDMRFILFALFVSFLVACSNSNVNDLKFTKDNKEQVIEKIRKSKDLTGEEVDLLMTKLMQTTSDIEGKTVGQLIQEQRYIVAKAKVAAELSKYILVTPFKKSSHYQNLKEEDIGPRPPTRADFLKIYKVSMGFVIENKSNKDIKAFKGEIKFKDVFGKELGIMDLIYEEGVKAGQKKNWYCEQNLLVDIDDHGFFEQRKRRKFRDTRLENMEFEWKPKVIVFADGSKLGLDN